MTARVEKTKKEHNKQYVGEVGEERWEAAAQHVPQQDQGWVEAAASSADGATRAGRDRGHPPVVRSYAQVGIHSTTLRASWFVHAPDTNFLPACARPGPVVARRFSVLQQLRTRGAEN